MGEERPKLPGHLVRPIINRYLKPEVLPSGAPTPRGEIVALHTLFKQYPSAQFWMHHELGFPLNSLFWFRSAEGQQRLESDWRLFHFEYPTGESTPPVDNASPALYPPVHYKTAAPAVGTLAAFLTPHAP